MARNLSKVVNALLDNIVAQPELKEDLTASLDTVVVSINDEDDLSTLFSVLFALIKHNDPKKRAIVAATMQNFFAHTELDYAEYHQEILRNLLTTFADPDAVVVKNAWAALNEFTKHLEKYEMEELVMYARQILRQVGTPGQNLPGFSDVPKGITAILPIFLQGLVNGSADQKATSAMAISDIVSKTSEDGLKPSALIITGPLIRFVTDRSPEVKAAILKALDDLLTKVPAALKAFLPQLQRTFAKSLADTSSEVVRNRAAAALGKLINHTPRVDPLIAELVAGSKTEDVGIRLAMMKALYQVVDKAGQNMSTASGKAILDTIDTINEDDEDHMPTMIANATLFGALINSVAKSVGADKAAPLLVDRAVQTPLDNISILALNAVLKYAPTAITETSYCDGLPGQLVKGIEHKDPFVADNAILAAGKFLLLLSNSEDKFQAEKTIYEALSKAIVPGKPADGRRLALLVVKVLAHANINHVKPHLKALATPIFSSIRDTIIPVKLAAEAAWMEIFEATEGSEVFDSWIAAQDDLPPATSRSMKDYFKRITLKIAKQKKEQREENEWMAINERKEDLREVNSVGKVDLEEEV